MYGITLADGLQVTRETATSDDHSSPMNPLGAIVRVDDGRAYRYVKFHEAAAAGQIVTPKIGLVNQDVDAAASDNTLTGTGDFSANAYQDGAYWVVVDAGASYGQNRRIKSNTANVLTLHSAWTTALTTSSDYQVHGGSFVVELCDAAIEQCAGVVLSAQSASYYGWVQVAGLAFVRSVGNTDPWVAYEGVMPSTTEGAAKGFTAGGTTADEAAAAFGFACCAQAAADSAGQLYPVILSKIVGA